MKGQKVIPLQNRKGRRGHSPLFLQSTRKMKSGTKGREEVEQKARKPESAQAG